MDALTHEIAAAAARLVVDEGLDYGAAKRRAGEQLGAPGRGRLPDNDLLEAAVREHLAIFHAETQPRELAALRRLALDWMERLAAFRPYVAGAVWQGTATRRSDIYLQLFCDDPKSAELALIDQGLRYEAGEAPGLHGEPAQALSLSCRCPELGPDGDAVALHLLICDHDDLRGALKARADGRVPRGDRAALARRMAQEAPEDREAA